MENVHLAGDIPEVSKLQLLRQNQLKKCSFELESDLAKCILLLMCCPENSPLKTGSLGDVNCTLCGHSILADAGV